MWNDEGSSDAFNQKSEIKDGKHKSDKIDNELNIAPMFENLNLNAYGSADIKPKEVVKPQMKPAVDIKPNDLHELASSFSKKTMAAESKFININVFDSDGQKCVLEVRNKAPIPASIIERMVDRKLRLLFNGQRVSRKHSDGTWCTLVDLDMKGGDSVNIFK